MIATPQKSRLYARFAAQRNRLAREETYGFVARAERSHKIVVSRVGILSGGQLMYRRL